MLKIRQLIKRIRSCRTAEEERSVINKESAEIRNLSMIQMLHLKLVIYAKQFICK